VRARGDPARGRALYLDSRRTQCASCHPLEGVGGEVGPDLTRSWETRTVPDLVEALLAPSKRIAEGFATHAATTAKGEVRVGLKVRDDAQEVVIRDAEGKDTAIPRADLSSLETSAVSLMPDGLVLRLSRAELIDLVAFLRDQAAQEALRGMLTRVWVVGPFSRALGKVEAFEKAADPLQIVAGERGALLQWQPLDAGADGRFDLSRAVARKLASAYVLAWVRAEKDQEAVFQVDFEDGVRLAINGETLFTSAPQETSAAVKARLRAGWNTVLARVARAGGPFTFRLRAEGGEGLRFSAEKP
jgi:putative heme-binding domain-containing protein